MISRAGATVEGFASASLRLRVSIGIEKALSFWKVKDAYVGLEVTGNLNVNVKMSVVAGLRLECNLKIY